MRPLLLLVPVALLPTLPALAAEPSAAQRPGPPARRQEQRPAVRRVPELGLGSLGAIPTGDGLTAGAPEGLRPDARGAGAPERYELVGVQHARAFVQSATGSRPRGAPLERITLRERPPRTEPFSTVVRVRSAARRGGPIEVVVLDPRGDTVMSASGSLSFTGSQGEVAEYLVDWEPTACRGPGAFSVLVRVAGEPLGTAALTVVAEGP